MFIATGYGENGNEIAAFIRINSNKADHRIYELQLSERNASRFKAKGLSSDFFIDEGTIIIKNNCVSSYKDLEKDDELFVVAKGFGNRYTAAVVYAASYEESLDFDVYYAYLKDVDVGDKVLVQTTRYYNIKDGSYNYFAKLKTFKLTSNTKLFDKDGVLNNRNLSSYSEIDGSRVYANIVTRDDEVVAMGIGDGGSYTLTARVGYVNSENSIVKSFYINNAEEYLDYLDAWEDIENQNLAVLNNTIYIKKGKAVSASDIKVGDSFIAYFNGRNEKTAVLIIVK